MGKVTDFLIEQIKKQIAENHIVVWFDEERGMPQFTEVVRNLEIPGATIIRVRWILSPDEARGLAADGG